METLTGCIEHLTYADPETFFTVAQMVCPGQKRAIVVTGTMPAIQVGETIHCSGVWKQHPRHGMQFEVASYELQLPQDARAIEKFLASGAVRGIGPAFAAKIVMHFGRDTLKVIDKEPKLLEQIEGLGQKRIDTLVSSWQEQKQMKELFVFLQGYGISRAYARKILRTYGSHALQKIKQNPYSLAKEVHGIGFRLADQIAKNLSISQESDERVVAGIDFVLYELAGVGQVCFPLELFIKRAQETLSVPEELVRLHVGRQFQKGQIELRTLDQVYIWSKPLFLSEAGIANEIKRLQMSASNLRQVDVEKALCWTEDKLKLHFAPLQQNAIRQVLTEKMCIVTGGPGTGKSTITKALIAIFAKLTDKIILAAPTGRAAKRLTEITHKYASTIHRLLKYDFTKGRFKYDRDTPLACDLIIIDESSMIDTYLMYQLLKAIPDSARVVLIGDVNQLPSIGPGNVLSDCIHSNTIPVTRLNAIFRQAAGSQIITNAHRINEGQMPFTHNPPQSDFLYVEAQEPEEVRAKILELVTKKIPERFGFDPKKEIQVLVPMRKGICGIDMLNRDLQQALTPAHGHHSHFRVGDKVMQMRNNYSKEVFNGDIGYVTGIDSDDGSLLVLVDDKEISYEPLELDELVLAYAVSIHKYQGSECPCVVMPVHTAHFKLLTRNLLYTGVTRGKKLVVLVGTKKAIAIAVKNEDVQQRYTGLKQALLA